MKDIFSYYKDCVSASESPSVFELGGCDGYHTAMMLEILVSSGKPFQYHVFEPVPELASTITQRIAHIVASLTGSASKVVVNNMAIGATEGTAPFYKSGGLLIENGHVRDSYYGSSSIRKPKLVTEAWKAMTFESKTCTVVTLDGYCSRNGIEEIDFIWADIQGAEIDLINGGGNILANTKMLYTEYANSEYYEGEIGLSEIANMLSECKMRLEHDFGGDALFVRR